MVNINNKNFPEEVIGFDPGYGWVKIVFSSMGNNVWDQRIFPALYDRNPRVLEKINNIPDDPYSPDFHQNFVFEIDGEKVAIGKGVENFASKIANEDFSADRSIEMPKAWLLATIAMIAATKGRKQFVVGWTVPVNLKNQEIQKIKSAEIKGVHHISMSDSSNNTFSTDIEIKSIYIVEQGLAALFNEVYDVDENGNVVYVNKELETKRVVIIDIGTNTINGMVIKNGKIIAKERWLQSGAANIVFNLREVLSQKGYDISYATIQEKFIVEGKRKIQSYKDGKFDYIDLTSEIEGAIKETFERRVEPIIDKFIRESKSEAEDIYKIIYTGGGVKLFAPYLKERFLNVQTVLPEHPQFANALGAWKTAMAKEIVKMK